MAPAKSSSAATDEFDVKTRKNHDPKRRLAPGAPSSSYPAPTASRDHPRRDLNTSKKPPPKKSTASPRAKPKPSSDSPATAHSRPKKTIPEHTPRKLNNSPQANNSSGPPTPKTAKPTPSRSSVPKKLSGAALTGAKYPNPHAKAPRSLGPNSNNKHADGANLHKGHRAEHVPHSHIPPHLGRRRSSQSSNGSAKPSFRPPRAVIGKSNPQKYADNCQSTISSDAKLSPEGPEATRRKLTSAGLSTESLEELLLAEPLESPLFDPLEGPYEASLDASIDTESIASIDLSCDESSRSSRASVSSIVSDSGTVAGDSSLTSVSNILDELDCRTATGLPALIDEVTYEIPIHEHTDAPKYEELDESRGYESVDELVDLDSSLTSSESPLRNLLASYNHVSPETTKPTNEPVSCPSSATITSEHEETDAEKTEVLRTPEETRRECIAQLEAALAPPPSYAWLTDLTADPRRYRVSKDPVSKLRFSTTFEAKQVVLKLLAVFSNIRRCHSELNRRLGMMTEQAQRILTIASEVRTAITAMPSREVAARCQVHWIFARAIHRHTQDFARPEVVPAKIVFAIEREAFEHIEEVHSEDLFCEYPSQKTMSTFLQFRESIDSVFKILFGRSPRVFMVASDLAYNLLATMDWEIYGEARDRLVNTAVDLLPSMRRYREFKECSEVLSSQVLEMCQSDVNGALHVQSRARSIVESFASVDLRPDSPTEAYDAALYPFGDAKHNQQLVTMRKLLGGGRIQRVYEQFMAAASGGNDRAVSDEYLAVKSRFVNSLTSKPGYE